MRRQGSLGGFSGTRRNTQRVAHSDPRDTKHAIDRFDITFHIGAQGAVVNRDLTNRQGPGQRAE